MAVLTKTLIGISLAAALLFAARAAAADSSPPSLAVIGFELDDDHPDPVRALQLRDRLTAMQEQLEKGLHDRGLYRVVDTAAAKDLIDALYERHSLVYRCNACFVEVGQRLGTRLVAVGWVQRVSELILNVNVSIRDAQTGTEILSKSVDLRGNTGETWTRTMNFMLRDWAERHARNPRYGQQAPFSRARVTAVRRASRSSKRSACRASPRPSHATRPLPGGGSRSGSSGSR